MTGALILGGGVSGLSAFWKLSGKMETTLLEGKKVLGGISSCFSYKDMTLDYGPHKVYTQNERLLGEVLSLFSEGEMLSIEKKSRVRLGGRFYSFPVRIPELLLGMNPMMTARLGVSYLLKSVSGKTEGNDYGSYIRNRFGNGLYDLVFGPMAEKVWGDPEKLSDELARTRVAMPSLLEIMKRTVLGDSGKPEISAKSFYYPKKGIAEISEKMKERGLSNGGTLSLNTQVGSIETEGGNVAGVKTENGRRIGCSHLISSIPLEEMVSAITPQAPESVLKAAGRLTHRNLVLAVLVVGRNRFFSDNWLFFPEKRYMFNRVYEQKGFSEQMVPGNKTAVCCEITCDPRDKVWEQDDKQITLEAARELEEAGLLKENEVVDSTVMRVEKAYPIYLRGYEKNLGEIMVYLDGMKNIYPVGRNGTFNYVGLMDCIDIGLRTSEHILGGGSKEDWKALKKSFRNYVTVD